MRRALKRVEVVRRECQRLQSLLDDFLNFAKVRRLHLEPIGPEPPDRRRAGFLRARSRQEAGVEIVRYLDPDLPRVMLDREAFRQALLNLIINAKQAMPDGGQLVVRTAAERGDGGVYLIDTGCGMDERTASQMFEAFFSTKPGGSGLGLADDAEDHRRPRRADRRAERSRPRHADYDRAAGAGAACGGGVVAAA